MRISVHIKPKSKHPEVREDRSAGVVEVYVSAPPVDGKANEEMLELLADYFEVAKSLITIVSGHTARQKIVDIPNWKRR
ncbi:MAG: hypothetical protein A3C84_00290 [Candidatus Ryanbacteria bacterium RIFCSPHIGHO2_02_FULL_48_12]|uniref:UPF0235 protein A2756_00150 n=1 Tax=Candidatus Ryanbacteria bacterium RIFCSPHIGHO2_01_FULL_48_27 TaxID=1802115 RepID=A0A1G2G577_9BACT|nr:MAG: hypothetical protein A2756_00150 [Candidatus Ryanbacteria bacterium RIFCSPHIGHO2_01_FULL_48_27]OGZ50415.1 MAG: hypothetical protein A3C84_00290 [Candidatus Ryanbacteria bacterium RIFCSPHIGHO2_02_FULL_48_12]